MPLQTNLTFQRTRKAFREQAHRLPGRVGYLLMDLRLVGSGTGGLLGRISCGGAPFAQGPERVGTGLSPSAIREGGDGREVTAGKRLPLDSCEREDSWEFVA